MQNQEQYNDGGIAAFARAAALKSVTLVSPAATHFTVMAMLSGPAMQLTRLELVDLGMCDDSPDIEASAACSAVLSIAQRNFSGLPWHRL